ncbi:MAG TPA: hypothetical protein VMU04_11265 [Candidatus Acidoferrum sp.]|nr:hypothetical protein [Candidatus Acidoferrum sp.]
MNEGRSGFPWLLLTVILVIGTIAVLWAFPILRVFPMVFLSVAQIRGHEAKMRKPEVYNHVAQQMAVYCQTGPAIFPTGFVGNAWLPKVVRDLNPSYTRITETNAHVGMGGGFHHYGYFLERQPNSSERSNLWTLRFLSEGADPKLLATFSTLAAQTIPMSNFVGNALEEYDRLSKTKQEYAEPLWTEQRRIAFLLQFDQRRVRDACLSAIHNLPNHWWPRLTLAMVDSAAGKAVQAERDFADWVNAKPSYSHYLCLCYYYQQMGRPEQAAEAIEKGIKCPIIDLEDDLTNTECRGYSAGVYAFRSGKYSTVIKLCDVLLPVRENGDYAKAALRALRSAAVSAQSGTVPPFEPSDQVLGFNPYDHVSLEGLRSLPN